MALSNPRIIFGIHSISPYNRVTKMPYGILKVIGSANLALSSDIEQLFAGSNKFAWAAEAKTVNSELTAKVKAYPGFLFELFLGASVTDAGVDSSGAVSTPVAGTGALINATTGLASIIVIPSTGAANLKFGKYVLKATSSTAVKLYSLTDIDMARGTDGSYVDDTLEVSGPHTVSDTGGTTDITAYGLRLTGGSGTVALTIGDTIKFEVKPPSASSSAIVVGSSTATFPSFGALLMAQKRATGELFEVDALNCLASGLPIALEEQAFSQPEIKMQCLYDSTNDAVFKIRAYVPA